MPVPKPKFGWHGEISADQPEVAALDLATNEVVIWDNPEYHPPKYEIYGAAAAFMKWYDKSRIKSGPPLEYEVEFNAYVEQQRLDLFKHYKQVGEPYEEFLNRFGIVKGDSSRYSSRLRPLGNAANAPDHHFLFLRHEIDGIPSDLGEQTCQM